ncbi:RICIN domain-containing protein [Dactylosporangium aurantiacum]|uniref:RICIN domain-containing protein n=1 Tax=Dactylosporangium aurantiacum TaxID=35754 RepID=A0A9Q9MIL1_9ACTN|nr:RICIN domain-containing protein [Dactylosporangium aurantiacum]MDG6105764.1 RICIN domain-containing protein [Dactylosporangium aurantiacum]UWZ58044.1 RICIN domain-containing protein [Dactylosporangium aurantiacum]
MHLRRTLLTAIVAAAAALTVATPAHAADESISVNFSVAGGSPTYRASGWIYGMTENGAGPADHFYRDVKFRAMRAGGAQLDQPGGWVSGKYDRRWNATRAQILRTAALGGTFVLLPHDLWGADGYPISRFPGDNGNWSDYDAFLTRVIADVKATGVTVQWDIWNEPNLGLFWNRPQSQYFELWRRTYQRLRADLPGTPLVGPSHAGVPSTSGWWIQYLDFVKANNVVPDIFSWHSLPSDPVANVATANSTLDARGIAHPRPYQINEYGASNEQNPGDGSWYIARLERAGADGLRANWASTNNLHNDLGNLLVRNSAGQHQPKGEWWVYRYYGSQTGLISSVTPSQAYDAFATKDTGVAKILVGGGGTTGNVAVNLQRLDTTTGIVQNNQVRVVVQRIPYNNGGAVQGPVTVQNTVVTLSGNATTVNLPHTGIDDTFTVTLLPPSDGGFQSVAVAQHSQQCLDNTGLGTVDGNRQQQFTCDGGDQQLWNFRPVTGVASTYTVVNQQSGKCLDVNGVSTADGAAVQQWTCNGGQNQQFTLRKVTYGGNDSHDYQLVARHSGKCVDVSAISTTPGALVHQWTCNPVGQGSPLNQTWRLWGR